MFVCLFFGTVQIINVLGFMGHRAIGSLSQLFQKKNPKHTKPKQVIGFSWPIDYSFLRDLSGVSVRKL